jgi:hypothetical protein
VKAYVSGCPGTEEVTLAWSEIGEVTCERRWLTLQGPWPLGYRADVYTITNMEIPHARRAAEEINALHSPVRGARN